MRATDADGGAEAGAGFETWFAGPANELATPADNFGQCLGGVLCPHGFGSTAEPIALENRLIVPETNLGGGVFLDASCVGSPNYPCPQGKGDPNGYAAAVYLYAADLTLEQSEGPTAANVAGELASAATVTGVSPLTFSASDPGAGVYEALFSVDGAVVQRSVIDEAGGRCRDVGQTSDGTAAFLYLQPCPRTVGADVAFDTTRVANGPHHVVVRVVDAAGNAATVLDRVATVYNPPPPGVPGPPNGVNASANATLSVRWLATRRAGLTISYGHSQTVTGRLTAPGGVPISSALVEVASTIAGGGGLPALTARSGADGRFTLRIPGGECSRTLRFAYRAHVGDAMAAATRTLTLRVRAGITLRISPPSAAVGRSIRFSGRLRGGPVPVSGKQLVLEARAPGGPWIEFRVARSDRRGRYRSTYRFRFAGPAQYEFRVVSEPESDYPYAPGASRVVSVHER